MKPLEGTGIFLRKRQRWVLVAMLAALHLTLWTLQTPVLSLMCWFVDVGLFLLWQPFIQAERRLGSGTLGLVILALCCGVWFFGVWLLMLWTTMLAALLGGRVLLLDHRPTRFFYLFAFAYLLAALLLWLVPAGVPDPALIGPSLEQPFLWGGPVLLVAMLLLPGPREVRIAGGGTIDFFYSLFIFLLIAVMVLGSLAFMLLRQAVYVEAVFKTLISMAAMLLLIAWAWNPRSGFAGLSVFLSRYVLSVGLPFESWLQRLMVCAEKEGDADRFLSEAFGQMLELPWIAGGNWHPAEGCDAGRGMFGQKTAYAYPFANRPLVLVLYTRHKIGPSMVWHFHLLAQLTNEYYVAKQRARELQQVGYLRAVHETGARLTHDVKNLLQSLNALCFMPAAAGDEKRFNELLQRQLPLIARRLQQTLEKLQMPHERLKEAGEPVPAAGWWETLQQRYSHEPVVFERVNVLPQVSLPSALFDSVADNLLQNALTKRQSEAGLILRVRLAEDATELCICDDGSPIPEAIANRLMKATVASETGLGIGLFNVARQAEALGYALLLVSNENGKVCFNLAKKPGQ